MKGKDVLLVQLDYMRYELGLEHIYCPEYEIPADLYEAFAAYCAEYVFDHDGYLKESGIFGGDDILNGIVNKLEELVGGPVEAIPFKGNLMVLYNRDAKYLGYDRNRRVFSDQHDGYIHGKFMIAKFVKGHYASCCLL